jgi:hypothetical protein
LPLGVNVCAVSHYSKVIKQRIAEEKSWVGMLCCVEGRCSDMPGFQLQVTSVVPCSLIPLRH